MAVALRLKHAEFLTAVKGKYGLWMSNEMKNASKTMLEFENAKAAGRRVDDQTDNIQARMVGAWYLWSVKKEFTSVNSKSNNICKVLAVEMGAIPDIDRESLTSAFVLYGEDRCGGGVPPKSKKPPRVEVTNLTVPAYMLGRKKGGVVLIDAFGGGDSQQAHGFTRKYGNQESTVIDNIKDVLETAAGAGMPVFNVTMGSSTTWKELVDLYPPKVIDIIKPMQPLFRGDADYVAKTRAKFVAEGIEYLVVVGWDANQCVAAAIFGVEEHGGAGFCPGIVDHGWDVVTSRNLLAANTAGQLDSMWGWPHVGPANMR
jgi:nicotinamidase-related amidase